MSTYLKRILLLVSFLIVIAFALPIIINIIKNNSFSYGLLLLICLFNLLVLAFKTVFTELYNKVKKEENQVNRIYKSY
jgi:hypothetical protein